MVDYMSCEIEIRSISKTYAKGLIEKFLKNMIGDISSGFVREITWKASKEVSKKFINKIVNELIGKIDKGLVNVVAIRVVANAIETLSTKFEDNMFIGMLSKEIVDEFIINLSKRIARKMVEEDAKELIDGIAKGSVKQLSEDWEGELPNEWLKEAINELVEETCRDDVYSWIIST